MFLFGFNDKSLILICIRCCFFLNEMCCFIWMICELVKVMKKTPLIKMVAFKFPGVNWWSKINLIFALWMVDIRTLGHFWKPFDARSEPVKHYLSCPVWNVDYTFPFPWTAIDNFKLESVFYEPLNATLQPSQQKFMDH